MSPFFLIILSPFSIGASKSQPG